MSRVIRHKGFDLVEHDVLFLPTIILTPPSTPLVACEGITPKVRAGANFRALLVTRATASVVDRMALHNGLDVFTSKRIRLEVVAPAQQLDLPRAQAKRHRRRPPVAHTHRVRTGGSPRAGRFHPIAPPSPDRRQDTTGSLERSAACVSGLSPPRAFSPPHRVSIVHRVSRPSSRSSASSHRSSSRL